MNDASHYTTPPTSGGYHTSPPVLLAGDARYALPVFTGRVRGSRVYGPCSRAVNTSAQDGRHFGHPCSRAVFTVTGAGPHYP